MALCRQLLKNHENLHFQHRQHSSMAPETTFRQYAPQAINHHSTDNAKKIFDSLLMQRWQNSSRTTKEEDICNLGSWETILGPTKGVAVLAQQSVLLFNTWDHFKIDDLIMFLGIGLLTKPGMLVLCFLHNLKTMLEWFAYLVVQWNRKSTTSKVCQMSKLLSAVFSRHAHSIKGLLNTKLRPVLNPFRHFQ